MIPESFLGPGISVTQFREEYSANTTGLPTIPQDDNIHLPRCRIPTEVQKMPPTSVASQRLGQFKAKLGAESAPDVLTPC